MPYVHSLPQHIATLLMDANACYYNTLPLNCTLHMYVLCVAVISRLATLCAVCHWRCVLWQANKSRMCVDNSPSQQVFGRFCYCIILRALLLYFRNFGVGLYCYYVVEVSCFLSVSFSVYTLISVEYSLIYITFHSFIIYAFDPYLVFVSYFISSFSSLFIIFQQQRECQALFQNMAPLSLLLTSTIFFCEIRIHRQINP